jgi:hypothetical protein
MTDEALRRAYQAGVSVRKQGQECPSPEALHGLVNREGDEATRLAVLDHVMRCAACRRDFELLRAVHVASRTRPDWRLQPLALAASIALLVGLGGAALWTRLAPPERDTLRGTGAQIETIRPAGGSVISPPLVFAWKPVVGAQSYTVELLTSDGQFGNSWTTSDTSITVSAQGTKQISPGSYAWWVRAHLPDGSERHSTVMRFELR